MNCKAIVHLRLHLTPVRIPTIKNTTNSPKISEPIKKWATEQGRTFSKE
jgi:hypothetical protein